MVGKLLERRCGGIHHNVTDNRATPQFRELLMVQAILVRLRTADDLLNVETEIVQTQVGHRAFPNFETDSDSE